MLCGERGGEERGGRAALTCCDLVELRFLFPTTPQRTLEPGSHWRKVQWYIRVVSAFKQNLRDALLFGGGAQLGTDAWLDRYEAWEGGPLRFNCVTSSFPIPRMHRARTIGTRTWWIILPHHPFRCVVDQFPSPLRTLCCAKIPSTPSFPQTLPVVLWPGAFGNPS
jgi:hypothetical protein